MKSLRRILRAVYLHSRYLASQFGLTSSQLVCLWTLKHKGELTHGALAREVALSQATITGIIDRLQFRGFVERQRSIRDRRRVTVAITMDGREMLARVPTLLQDRFSQQLATLPDEEKQAINKVLDRIVTMMGVKQDNASTITSSEEPFENIANLKDCSSTT